MNKNELMIRKEQLEAELLAIKAEIKTASKVNDVIVKVGLDTRKKIVALINEDAKRTTMRANGYKWPVYMASKVYYAAKATGAEIDPAKMNDNTALTLAKAYNLI